MSRRASRTVALAVASPVLVVVFFVFDARSGSSPGAAWLLIPFATALAAGLIGGVGTGIPATIGAWLALCALLLLLFGPGCPIDLSAAPHGTAALGFIGRPEHCSDGTTHSALGGNAVWAFILGVVTTVLTTAGAVVGDTVRWWRRRHPSRASGPPVPAGREPVRAPQE